MASNGGERSVARRTRLAAIVRWVGTLGLGAYIVSRIDLASSWAVLWRAEGSWVLVAVVLYGFDRLAAAGKWRLLLVAKGYRFPVLKAFSVYLESSFLGAVLPATVGSDLIRARMVQGHTSSFASSLSAVVVERFAGLIGLGVVACIGLLAFAPAEYGRMALSLTLWGVVGLSLLWLGLRGLRWIRRGRSAEPGASVLGRVRAFSRELAGRLVDYRKHRGVLSIVLLIAVAQQYLLTAINWILALALGMDVSLVTMLWIWPVVMLAIRIPISVMGFGVREVLLIELMGSIGVAESEALTLGVVSGLLDVCFVLLGGALVAISRRPIARELTDPGATDAAGS